MPRVNCRIPLTAETRDALKALKEDDERYEDVLRRLLDEREQEHTDGGKASPEA